MKIFEVKFDNMYIVLAFVFVKTNEKEIKNITKFNTFFYHSPSLVAINKAGKQRPQIGTRTY